MDVGATSLGKETDKSADNTASRSAASSDINAQLIATTLQESATSRLSSLLSTLVAEPLAAAPRMPQQHTLKSTNVGEKATLPQPVATPNFHIPPHVMGRNLNNPSEDPVSHSRRIQKPRLGVRVPYRNLTSQIVTQDELAQELLERSLKNHPVHDIPEGGDLFFAIKLTQRLASKLSPGNSQSASGASNTDQSPGKSSQTVLRADSKSTVTRKDPNLLPETRELIAILEGDGEDDWLPSGTQTVHNPVKIPSIPPQPTATQINAKLDPVLEKELALKQLMEFQNMSRRRKSDKKQTPGDKPKKQRGQPRKTPVNKENGLKGSVMKRNSDSGSKPSLNSSASKRTTNQANPVKATRKRKIEDITVVSVAKKPRVSGKKSMGHESKGILPDKSDGRIQRKTKAKSISPNTSSPPVGLKSKGVNSAVPKENGSKSAVNKPKKSISPMSPGKRKSPNSLNIGNSNSTINSTLNNSVSPVQFKVGMPSVHSPLLADDLPEFSRSFSTPIRTYSPKKKTSISHTSSNVQTPDAAKSKEDENLAKTKIKTERLAQPEPEEDKLSLSQKKKDVKDSTADNKKKKMSEVDRLLMDEGAINLLYEAERGESRRRSNAPEEAENVPVNQRKILKSVRRKKKDLLLKTRLVKNAVLRLSNSPSSVVSISSRITRRTEPPGSLTTFKQVSEPQRKLSFESKDSVGSPAPATPLDPPSPQTFVYTPRLPLTAEASRIIRRHSSSSNFSSRSASPNNIRPGDSLQLTEHSTKHNEAKIPMNSGKPNDVNAVKITGQGRKKGFPIFVRKPQVIQTYQGKKKKISPAESKNSSCLAIVKSSNKVPQQNKEGKAPGKTLQKIAADKKRAVIVKKISISDKLKLKAEMSKNFQKGFNSGKVKVLKKALENSAKSKKKEDLVKEKGSTGSVEETPPDLSSCLAAAASAFAAEGLEARDERSSKKSGSSGASHSSSPCPSRSSKSPTPTGRTGRKDPRIAPPLSPNAATYTNLLKTLENESQKPRKKREDGEEVTKQRSSVRQNAGTYHYKDISLRRYDNLVQVILTPQSTKMKNALNLQVLRELKDALHLLKKDDSCRAVLLTSTGSSFCQGVDFHSLLHTNTEKRKTAAQELAQALKEFLKSLALFNKPIVAGVHGAAVGLGVTMLPFFDMVFASDKATFYTPYAKLGQVPEGAAILTLPHMFGNAVTSELLFGCRKLTASEALHFGLVTRILWPDRFQEELIPVIRSMANQSSQSMEATKALLRHNLRTKLDAALESETHLLVQHWISAECQTNFKKFLEEGDVGLQKQRLEA